jgi:hypothetical protein
MPEPSARDHSAGQALGGEWASRLAAGASPEELEAAVLATPAADVPQAIKALAAAGGASAVPLLDRLGLSDRRDLALAASEALGTIRAGEAAEAAERIAADSSDKAVQKAARRSVYRLSSQGIRVAHAAPEATATIGSREATLYRVVASSYDGAGNRAIWFGAERPLGAPS